MALDRLVRGLVMRLRASWLPRGRVRVADPRDSRRVLVLRHDRIGDVLMTLPLLRALAEHGLEVDVLASAANAPLLAAAPWVRVVHVHARRGWPRRALLDALARRRYDAVIDGLVLKAHVNTETARLIAASRAPVRVGAGGRDYDFVFTHRVMSDRPAVNHAEYVAALAEPFGASRARALEPTPLPFTDDEISAAEAFWRGVAGSGPALLVNLSAGHASRRWPDERFVEVIRAARARRPGLRVGISASPDERAAAERVAAAVGGEAVVRPLRQAFAIASRADVVLTPDTSVVHLAAGYRIPQVILTSPIHLPYAPYASPARLIESAVDRLDAIPAEPVAAALAATLDALR